MCLIDTNKFFQNSMTFETCLVFMHYVDYGFNNKKNYICIKHSYLSMPMLIRVLKTWKVFKVHLEHKNVIKLRLITS